MRLTSVPVAALAAVAFLGGCADGAPADEGPSFKGASGATSVMAHSDPALTVTLDVGHCRIERLVVDGQGWVSRKDSIGYGGGLPDEFTATGTFVVLDANTAMFTSEGGARVPFKAAPNEPPPPACD